jgi:hypothetical protein
MKTCPNHTTRPVFSKGLCRQCWGMQYGKPIKKESKKRAKQNRKYSKEAKEWKEGKTCQAQLEGCVSVPVQVHHMEGRIGDLLLDKSKWLAVCHPCHEKITEDSKQAIELGLSYRRIRA